MLNNFTYILFDIISECLNNSKKPKLFTNMGGLSGPAIKPIAIANVYKIYQQV